MSRKRIIFAAALLLSLIITAVFVLNIPRNPDSFISKTAALKRLNAVMGNEVSEIQEKMIIDEKHVFLPFKTKEGRYGVSFWVWKKNEWKMTTSDNGGEPKKWVIGKGSQAKSYIVYNLHPDDKISEIKFYLLKDRNFHASADESEYTPSIQIEHTAVLNGTSYGVIPYPESWVSLDRLYRKQETSAMNEEINLFPFKEGLKVGHQFYGSNGKEIYPKHTLGDFGYGNDHNVKYIMYVEAIELE